MYNECIVLWLGERVHQAFVKINHWITLRCILSPCKNIKPCVSIDKRLEGISARDSASRLDLKKHPPLQQYLFPLLIPAWSRQQDPTQQKAPLTPLSVQAWSLGLL